MNAACETQPIDDLDVQHRQNVLAGMQSETFKELFRNEFTNLREAIKQRDWPEVTDTIEALEACAVDACEKFDEQWKRAEG